MIDKALLQQALDALSDFDYDKRQNAITALRERLAQPEQQPIAWMDRDGDLYKMPEIKGWALPHTMLYATPTHHQWQGLTKPEFEQAVEGLEDLEDCWIAIEAKLREKNI